MFVTAGWYFKNANDLSKATQQIEQQEDYKDTIDELSEQIRIASRIIFLQNELMIEKAKMPVDQEKIDMIDQELYELMLLLKN